MTNDAVSRDDSSARNRAENAARDFESAPQKPALDAARSDADARARQSTPPASTRTLKNPARAPNAAAETEKAARRGAETQVTNPQGNKTSGARRENSARKNRDASTRDEKSSSDRRAAFPTPSQAAAQRTQARYAAIRALIILENSDRPLSAALEDALRHDESSRPENAARPENARGAIRENRASQTSQMQREYSRAIKDEIGAPAPQARNEAPEISRGFVRELVAGVCRHRARLDFTLAPLLKKPLEKLDAPVRAALRLATYERIVLQTPPHVVADEYAEAMRAARLKSAVGFVNAVARKLPESWREFPEKQRGSAAHLACEYSHPLWLAKRWIARLGFENARALCAANNEIAPLSLRVNTRVATREEILAELSQQELTARAGAFSLDAISVERAGAPDAWPSWKRGEIIAQDEAAQLVSHFALHGLAARNENAALFTSEKLTEKAAAFSAFNEENVTPQKAAAAEVLIKSREKSGVTFSDDAPISAPQTSPFTADETRPESAASQIDATTNWNLGGDARENSSLNSDVKSFFEAAPTRCDAPFTVVDLCAAPGGKATHLAQLLGNDARVLALDSAPGRVRLIEENALRLGLKVEAFCGDVRDASTRETLRQKIGGADLVLVDAPCSGTGTLRRRPDAKWRKTPSQLTQLVELQRELLDAAATTVRVGGVLVYSTCSLEPDENEEQARAFLSRRREYSLLPPQDISAAWRALLTDEGFLRTSPAQHGCDGAFAARFRRNK